MRALASFGRVVALVAVALVAPAAAHAATTTISFEAAPDGSPAAVATAVTDQYPGVRFADAKTADPPTIAQPKAATASAPFVLQAGGACDLVNETCPAHALEASLDGGATRVSLAAGLDDQPAGKDGIWATLRAYDAEGALVASSGDVRLDSPITAVLTVEATKALITRVRLDVGADTEAHDAPDGAAPFARRAIVDDLTIIRPDPEAKPPPTPRAPTVTLSAPVTGRYGRGDAFRAQGSVRGGRPIAHVCVNIDTPPPATCTGPAPAGDGSFDLPVPTVAPGAHTIHVLAVDSAGLTGLASVPVTITLTNLRAEWLEVSQGTQYFPPRDSGLRFDPFPDGDAAQTMTYGGVRLGAGVPTVVRALITLPWVRDETDRTIVPPAALYGYEERAGGGLVSLGPGVPEMRRPSRMQALPDPVPVTDRLAPGRLYEFQVPAAWTTAGRRVRLVVDADPGPQPLIPQDRLLEIDDAVAVSGVAFQTLNRMIISPVELMQRGTPRPGAAGPLIEPMVRAMPGRAIGLSWRSTIDVTGYTPDGCYNPFGPCSSSLAARNDGELADRFEDWYDDSSFWGVPVGIGPMVQAGVTQGGRYAVATSANRPLTSIAHEVTHVLGQAHASGACGGGSGGQRGTSWPPDQVGLLNGVALDRRPGTNPTSPAFTVVQPQSPPGVPQGVYDYMSYCGFNGGGDPGQWLSPRTWDSLAWDLRPGGALAYTSTVNYGEDARRVPPAFTPEIVQSRAAGSSDQRVEVRLEVETDGSAARVRGVAPTAAPPTADTASPTSITVQAVAADGSIVDDATVEPRIAYAELPDGAVPIASARAVLRSTGATSVRVLAADGRVTATRARSAHAPTVRILTPATGGAVAPGSTVHWTARDADGDLLRARVQSSDDGKTWRTIAGGVRSSQVTLPAGAFAGSTHASLRVLVSDGFHESGAAVDRLRATGAPAVVQIDGPKRRTVRSDGVLVLTGAAALEVGAPVSDRALRWTLDERPVGNGASVDLRGLTPGRHRVTLIASPRGARGGRATVTVTVRKVALRFAALKPLGRARGTTVRVRVATTEPARVTDARGRSIAIGVVPRTLALAVKRTARSVRVTARTADGRRTAASVRIRR